jgi:L-threonylcarbamoyladenylate synthase
MPDNNNITTNIDLAVTHLRAGDLVAFPTETVYGLGADATNPIAIAKVFTVKGRPADHPVIVHIANSEQLSFWAKDIPPAAWLLAKAFWPGPLTMILTKQDHISNLITGGQTTIGIRIPAHPLTLELINKFGAGIVGPSANKYGRVSPTNAQHVAHDLGNAVSAILDGGDCSVGIESTIIDLSSDQPMIMRLGAISAEQISAVLHSDIALNTDRKPKIRAPGSHESHYAPNTPVQLIATDKLLACVDDLLNQHRSFSVISLQAKPTSLAANLEWQQMSNNPSDYAHDLYAALRAHDQLRNDLILIEEPPRSTEWLAVLDRLTRASTPVN